MSDPIKKTVGGIIEAPLKKLLGRLSGRVFHAGFDEAAEGAIRLSSGSLRRILGEGVEAAAKTLDELGEAGLRALDTTLAVQVKAGKFGEVAESLVRAGIHNLDELGEMAGRLGIRSADDLVVFAKGAGVEAPGGLARLVRRAGVESLDDQARIFTKMIGQSGEDVGAQAAIYSARLGLQGDDIVKFALKMDGGGLARAAAGSLDGAAAKKLAQQHADYFASTVVLRGVASSTLQEAGQYVKALGMDPRMAGEFARELGIRGPERLGTFARAAGVVGDTAAQKAFFQAVGGETLAVTEKNIGLFARGAGINKSRFARTADKGPTKVLAKELGFTDDSIEAAASHSAGRVTKIASLGAAVTFNKVTGTLAKYGAIGGVLTAGGVAAWNHGIDPAWEKVKEALGISDERKIVSKEDVVRPDGKVTRTIVYDDGTREVKKTDMTPEEVAAADARAEAEKNKNPLDKLGEWLSGIMESKNAPWIIAAIGLLGGPLLKMIGGLGAKAAPWLGKIPIIGPLLEGLGGIGGAGAGMLGEVLSTVGPLIAIAGAGWGIYNMISGGSKKTSSQTPDAPGKGRTRKHEVDTPGRGNEKPLTPEAEREALEAAIAGVRGKHTSNGTKNPTGTPARSNENDLTPTAG